MEHATNDTKIARDEAMEVVVIGNNHLDFYVRLNGVDPGWDCSASADAMKVMPGGGGLNTSIRLAQLGIKTAYVGCVGAECQVEDLAFS